MLKRVLLCSPFILTGCDWIAQKATETAIEQATGSEIEIDGEKVTIRSKDGKAVIQKEGGQMVLENEEGRAVIQQDGDKVVMKSDEGQAVFEGSEDGSRAEIKTKDGTFKVTSEAPTDFPLPLFEGGVVLRSTDIDSTKDGKVRHVMLEIPDKKPEEIGSFYEKALEEKGLTVERMETKTKALTMIVLSGKSEKVQAVVQITKSDKGKNAVNISFSEKP